MPGFRLPGAEHRSGRDCGLILGELGQGLTRQRTVEIQNRGRTGAGSVGVEFAILALLNAHLVGPDCSLLIPLLAEVGIRILDGGLGLAEACIQELQHLSLRAGLVRGELVVAGADGDAVLYGYFPLILFFRLRVYLLQDQ